MKSGYKVLWTKNALEELNKTIEYLEQNFSEKEIHKLANKIENISELISQNPHLFSKLNLKYFHSFQTDKALKSGNYKNFL
jgi:plasmid stabilization system protein ParE